VRYQERRWLVTEMGLPPAVRQGDALRTLGPPYVVLVAADGPPARITVYEPDWHLLEVVPP
jgi:hypothetical protein